MISRLYTVALAALILTPLAFAAGHPVCATPAYTVEELPIDKFDDYSAGALPPAPWHRLKGDAPGVSFKLSPDAESPFVGNTVTGKGLTMLVSAPGKGAGDGLERTFTPAPPGGEFLAFDFKLLPADNGAKPVDLVCELVDADAKGLVVTIGAEGVRAQSAKGYVRLGDVASGQWQHLAARISSDRKVSLALTRFGSKSTPLIMNDIELPNSKDFDTIRFKNGDEAGRQGGWSMDNVLMAGQVDASRAAWWPFNQIPIEKLRATEKKVFAYYFPIYTAGPDSEDPSLSWYSRTIKNPATLPSYNADRAGSGTEFEYCPLPYPPMDKLAERHAEWVRAHEHEVRLARQMGIDGFYVDIESFPSSTGGTYFNEQAISVMEAAQMVDPAFKIILAIYGPDGVAGGATDEKAVQFANADIVKQALSQPNLYRLADGRIVITSYYPEAYPASWWQKALAALEKNGIKAAFVPQFNSLTHLTEFSSISYGMANWGPRTPGHFDWVSRVKGLTTKCIFPIVEQDIRTRGPMYFESEGSALLRGLWENAIADGADWAYINTWSDYTEQAMAPSRAIGFAPFDMDAYYTQWFKTGSKPEIKRDVLYYFYRIHHSSAPAARGAVWTMPPWVQNRDPYNWIEVVGFLKKPGTLRIDVDGKTYEKEAPAGITSFKAPVPPGRTFVPVFSLERGGKTVVSRPGQYAVLDKVEFRNLLCHSGVISPDAAR